MPPPRKNAYNLVICPLKATELKTRMKPLLRNNSGKLWSTFFLRHSVLLSVLKFDGDSCFGVTVLLANKCCYTYKIADAGFHPYGVNVT